MADWTELLPRFPKPQTAAEVYQDSLKSQQERQNLAYTQARAQEQQVATQQRQRSMDAQNALSQALSENMSFDDQGNIKVNYSAAIKKASDAGFGQEAITLGKLRHEDLTDAANQIKAQTEQNQKKAEHIGDLFGSSFRVQNWNDPNEVSRARTEALASIDQGVQAGLIDPQTATAERAKAANYGPDYQSSLDQRASFGKTLGNRFSQAKNAIDTLTEQITAPAKRREAEARADKEEAGATREEMGLASQVYGAGATLNSTGGQNGTAPALPYQATTPPQMAPQGTPATPVGPMRQVPGIEAGGFSGQSDMLRDANGNVFQVPRGGASAPAQTVPQQTPPPAAGTPQSTVPVSQAPPAAPPLGQFDTKLTPQEETKFQDWKAKYAPKDSGADYDLRGAFKAGLTPDPTTGHWPDTFKKPNHPTFSDQSQYAPYAPDKAGRWEGDTYIPPGEAQKPAGWTQEGQARLDALRNDPTLSRSAKFLPKMAGDSADKVIKALGLTREQQVTQPGTEARNQEASVDLERKGLNLWAQKLGAAARRGPGSYAVTLATAPDNIKALAPDPDKWDPDKTPKQVAALGETSAQQETDYRPPKTPGANGMSESQTRMWVDRHDKLQLEEHKQWDLAGEIGDVLSNEALTSDKGGAFVDPKTGKSVEVKAGDATAAKVIRDHWQKEYQSARDRAVELKKQATEIRGRLKVGEFETGAGGAESSPAAPVERVQIRAGDGRVGFIPKANLERAKALDPRLQVIP